MFVTVLCCIFFEDWSNIFCTRLFDMSDSATVLESISPFLLSSLHQISTLDKFIFRQHSILSCLMSKRPLQVSPFLDAAQSTSSEVLDFQMWSFLDFLMQWRQVRSDPLRCIARPNSSSASILLWLFLHLYLFAFFSTSLQNNW